MKEKIVNIYNLNNIKDYRIDETVIVTASTKIEFNAILLAFIIPFIIMVVTLFIVASTTSDELLSAIASLFVLVPYYVVLYYNRGRIREKLSFEIER